MILGIDTSLGTALAVVEHDGVVLAQLDSSDPRGHAEVIGTMMQQVLAEARLAASDITHVAVGMGPGPFTGLRVGIAAARAFALGRAIPVIPVPSHDAVALELLLHDALTGGYEDAQDEPFAVATDARRREFAYTIYRGLDEDGLAVRVAGPALAPREELDAILAAHGALRRDAERIPAAMLGIAAGRALAAGRELASSDALYLRSPDVTVPAGAKKVTAAAGQVRVHAGGQARVAVRPGTKGDGR